MKRLIGIIIAICLVCSLVSCVKKETRVTGQVVNVVERTIVSETKY